MPRMQHHRIGVGLGPWPDRIDQRSYTQLDQFRGELSVACPLGFCDREDLILPRGDVRIGFFKEGKNLRDVVFIGNGCEVQDRFLEPCGLPSLWKLSTSQFDQLQRPVGGCGITNCLEHLDQRLKAFLGLFGSHG